MKRGIAAVLSSALLFGVLAGLAYARAAQSTKMTAKLNATIKTAKGSGHFTGSLLRYSNGRSKLTWKLTYKNLGQRAKQAEVLIPASKKHPGQVYVLLCRPCKTGAHGVVPQILKPSTKALVTRPSFVVVSTKKRPQGALRGRIVRSG